MWLLLLVLLVVLFLYFEVPRWRNRSRHHLPEIPVLGAIPLLFKHGDRWLDFITEQSKLTRVFDSYYIGSHYVCSINREDIQYVLKDAFWNFEKGESLNEMLGR
jgi:hypothetical protein